MFDLTSSKLLILGVVALIVVGPKELPFLLRTLGKYMAMVRRHANEFRSQFDAAMREAELDGIRKDLESVARDTENTIRSAQSDVEQQLNTATQEIDSSLQSPAVASDAPSQTEPTTTTEAVQVTSSDAATATEAAEQVASEQSSHPAASETPIAEPAPTELAKTGT